mgnify:CR=1 FL=1
MHHSGIVYAKEVPMIKVKTVKEKNGKARAIISGDQIPELKEQDDRPVLMEKEPLCKQ